MSAEEVATPQESASTEPAPPNAPVDFPGYVKWRKTGELPAEAETPPVAATEEKPTPPAETEPEPGPEEPQQDEEEESEEEEPAARRPGSRRRRYDRLARENEALKAQIAALSQPKAEPPKPQSPPGKPKLEDYQTLEAYQEALTDWNIDQREAKRKAEADAKAAQDAQQKLQTDWDSKQRAVRKAHADFDDVIESVAAPEGPGVMAARQAMLEDDAGAEILYYLGTHKDELKRIAALPPLAAVREIGRLSAILSPPPAANGNRITAAPKPPPGPTRPGKTVSDSIFDPAVQSDFRRYVKARRAMKEK